MHTVTVAQAKTHFSEILGYVEIGETVIVTKRGKAIASIEAVKKTLKPLKTLSSFRNTLPKSKTSSVDLIRKLRDEGY